MNDRFSDIAQREQQLFDQLAACPVVEMTGVVSPSGVAAGKAGREKLWSLLMPFDAWRVGSGPLQTDSITIRRKVSDRELRALQDRIEAETIIKIHARVAYENVFGSPQALLEQFIRVDASDSELRDYLTKLQEPVTHEDDFFGMFSFDRRVSWYTAQATWSGESIDLNLSADDPEELDAALKVAHALWGDETVWSRRVRDYATQQLLPLKNENWLDEDEAELTAEQFEHRMTLESITVYAGGSFEFWHDDGDLFWGHSIQISGSLSAGLTDADIPG